MTYTRKCKKKSSRNTSLRKKRKQQRGGNMFTLTQSLQMHDGEDYLNGWNFFKGMNQVHPDALKSAQQAKCLALIGNTVNKTEGTFYLDAYHDQNGEEFKQYIRRVEECFEAPENRLDDKYSDLENRLFYYTQPKEEENETVLHTIREYGKFVSRDVENTLFRNCYAFNETTGNFNFYMQGKDVYKGTKKESLFMKGLNNDGDPAGSPTHKGYFGEHGIKLSTLFKHGACSILLMGAYYNGTLAQPISLIGGGDGSGNLTGGALTTVVNSIEIAAGGAGLLPNVIDMFVTEPTKCLDSAGAVAGFKGKFFSGDAAAGTPSSILGGNVNATKTGIKIPNAQGIETSHVRDTFPMHWIWTLVMANDLLLMWGFIINCYIDYRTTVFGPVGAALPDDTNRQLDEHRAMVTQAAAVFGGAPGYTNGYKNEQPPTTPVAKRTFYAGYNDDDVIYPGAPWKKYCWIYPEIPASIHYAAYLTYMHSNEAYVDDGERDTVEFGNNNAPPLLTSAANYCEFLSHLLKNPTNGDVKYTGILINTIGAGWWWGKLAYYGNSKVKKETNVTPFYHSNLLEGNKKVMKSCKFVKNTHRLARQAFYPGNRCYSDSDDSEMRLAAAPPAAIKNPDGTNVGPGGPMIGHVLKRALYSIYFTGLKGYIKPNNGINLPNTMFFFTNSQTFITPGPGINTDSFTGDSDLRGKLLNNIKEEFPTHILFDMVYHPNYKGGHAGMTGQAKHINYKKIGTISGIQGGAPLYASQPMSAKAQVDVNGDDDTGGNGTAGIVRHSYPAYTGGVTMKRFFCKKNGTNRGDKIVPRNDNESGDDDSGAADLTYKMLTVFMAYTFGLIENTCDNAAGTPFNFNNAFFSIGVGDYAIATAANGNTIRTVHNIKRLYRLLLRLTKYNGDSGHVIKLEEECKTLLKHETCGSPNGESQYRFLFGLAERPLFCRMCTKFRNTEYVEFCVASTNVITDAWESGIPQTSLNEYWQQKRPNDYNGEWLNNSVLKNGIHPDGVVLTADNKLPDKTIVHMKFTAPPSDEELFVTKVKQLNSMFNFRWMDVFFLRVMHLCFKQQLDNQNILRLVKKDEAEYDDDDGFQQLAQLLIHNICIYPSSSNDNYEDHSIVVKDEDDKYEYKFKKEELVKGSLIRCLIGDTDDDDSGNYVYTLKEPDSVLDTIVAGVDFEKEPVRVVYLVFKANKQLFNEIFQSMVEHLKPVSEANVKIHQFSDVTVTLETLCPEINNDFTLFETAQAGGLLDVSGNYWKLFPKPGRRNAAPNDNEEGFMRKLFPDLSDKNTKKLREVVTKQNGIYDLLRYINDLVSKYPLQEEKIQVLKFLLNKFGPADLKRKMCKLLFRMYFFYNLLNPTNFPIFKLHATLKGGKDYFRLLYKLLIIEITGSARDTEKGILQEDWKQFFELGAKLGKFLIDDTDTDNYDKLFIFVLNKLKGSKPRNAVPNLVGDISSTYSKISNDLVLKQNSASTSVADRYDLYVLTTEKGEIDKEVVDQLTTGVDVDPSEELYLSTDLTNTKSVKKQHGDNSIGNDTTSNNSAILSDLAVKMPPPPDAADVNAWKKSKNSQLTNHILGIDNAVLHQYRELQVI